MTIDLLDLGIIFILIVIILSVKNLSENAPELTPHVCNECGNLMLRGSIVCPRCGSHIDVDR